MRKIILATNNQHKVQEIKRIFKLYQFLTLKDIGFDKEIVEDGLTFEENALIKAREVYDFVKNNTKLDCAVLADDSGLCVKAINYEPGVYSARYSGLGDEGNRKKVLEKLLGIQDRTKSHNKSRLQEYDNNRKTQANLSQTHTLRHAKL